MIMKSRTFHQCLQLIHIMSFSYLVKLNKYTDLVNISAYALNKRGLISALFSAQ